MSKLLSLAALLFASTAAANTVVPIAESQNGDRLIAVAETFQVKPNNRGLEVASIVTFWASKPNEQIFWAVDATSCDRGGGEIIAVGGEPQRVERYFWTPTGNRIYDEVAAQLCKVRKLRENAVTPQDEKPEEEPTGESV